MDKNVNLVNCNHYPLHSCFLFHTLTLYSGSLRRFQFKLGGRSTRARGHEGESIY